jgi:hypothetical protein
MVATAHGESRRWHHVLAPQTLQVATSKQQGDDRQDELDAIDGQLIDDQVIDDQVIDGRAVDGQTIEKWRTRHDSNV